MTFKKLYVFIFACTVYSLLHGLSSCNKQVLCFGAGCLIVVASPSWGAGAQKRGSQILELASLQVVAHVLRCPTPCGNFPNQVSDPCPLHWKVISTTGPPKKFNINFKFTKYYKLQTLLSGLVLKWSMGGSFSKYV